MAEYYDAEYEAQYLKDVEDAVESFDRQAAERVCKGMVDYLQKQGRRYPDREAKRVLGQLRRKRFFNLMQRTAEGFMQAGQQSPLVRRQYAQALLDQKIFHAAVHVLNQLKQELEERTSSRTASEKEKNAAMAELAEARGLLGRAFKQIYVDAPNAEGSNAKAAPIQAYLMQAIDLYTEEYKRLPKANTWHGINAVALLLRARRDGIKHQNDIEAESIAREILETIQDKELDGKANAWDAGTAAEACWALGDEDAALEWLAKYVENPYADAFEFASTLRQFKEVWQLSETQEPGSRLLTILMSTALNKSGGSVDVQLHASSADLQRITDPKQQVKLEKVFGRESFKTFKWFANGIERAKAIAQIEDDTESAVGTGFLVLGKDLHESLGEKYYMLTNAHVISEHALDLKRGALAPEDAIVKFEVLEGEIEEREVAALIWSSPHTELDATLVSLSPEVPLTSAQPYKISRSLPLNDGEQRVYVIGHPQGRKLSFSLHDNILLDHEKPEPRLHYRAPTEPGSSGSPVFNSSWKLIGLHHAGSEKMPRLDGKGTYQANEGIWIQSILARLRADLAGT